MKGDSLGDRMKKYYEGIWKVKLPRRMPMIIRVDGKAFHTYTRGCEKPFDYRLMGLMDETAVHLCENIQGAKLAYVQSDEISILVHDYTTLSSEAWFDKELQKMCAISAATASVFFSMNSWKLTRLTHDAGVERNPEIPNLLDVCKPALFDSRCFVLPENEVANYFWWRQQDAVRNSIQMQARSLYSHKECDHKNQSDLQEMIHQKGQNWNDTPTGAKRGRCVYRQKITVEGDPHYDNTPTFERNPWVIDREIPIFTKDRDFIERHLKIDLGEDGKPA